jgi:hypothetical protein
MQRDRRRVSRTIVLLLVLVGVSRAMALDIDDLRITKQGRAYRSHAFGPKSALVLSFSAKILC